MTKTKKAIVFGVGHFSELVHFYLENDSCYTVEAFCASSPESSEYLDKPLVDFEIIQDHYPPAEYEIFIAIGYRKMNALRREFCEKARAKGYTLLSYISSKAIYWDKANRIGENVFIFEGNNIQPFVEIGDGVILWSGNHIGHHSKIGEFTFVTSHVVISGSCEIGNQSFIGVNATIVDRIKIGKKVLIGAGAYISKRIEDEQVIVANQSRTLDKKSDLFLK